MTRFNIIGQCVFITRKLCRFRFRWHYHACHEYFIFCPRKLTLPLSSLPAKRNFVSTNYDESIDSQHFSLLDINKSETSKLQISQESENGRIVLFPENQDPIIQDIVASRDPEELFSVILKNGIANLLPSTACQCIMTLWDQQKEFSVAYPWQKYPESKAPWNSPHINLLTRRVQEGCHELPDVVLSSVLLAMYKLELPTHECDFQQVLMECHRRCCSFHLPELSRYAIVIRSLQNAGLIFQSKFMQRLADVLKEPFDDEEDVKCAATCVFHMQRFIVPSLLNTFASRLKHFLQKGRDEISHRTLLKCLNIFVHSQLQHEHLDVIWEMLDVVQSYVPQMTSFELATLSMVTTRAECNVDPLKSAIENAANAFLHQDVRVAEDYLNAAYSLSVVESNKSDVMVNIQKSILESLPYMTFDPKICQRILMILRQTFLPEEILDAFWNTVATKLLDLMYHRSLLCLSYLYLRQSSLRAFKQSYRNENFEQEFTKWILNAWTTELFISPKDVSLFGAFLFACNKAKTIPPSIRQNVVDMLPQFSSQELKKFAMGFKFQRFNFKLPSSAELDQISYQMFGALISLIQCANSLQDLNSLVETRYFLIPSNKQGIDGLQEQLLNKYPRLIFPLSPKLVTETMKVMARYRYCLPPIIDAIARYTVRHHKIIPGECFASLLNACYVLSYCPDCEDILEVCSHHLIENTQFLSSHELLRSALALGLFQSMEYALVSKIFSVSFMDKLDHEIARNSSLVHIANIRHLLMKLNRMVCLDYPEFEIPWFHETYCKDYFGQVAYQQSALEEEVYEILCEVLGGHHFVRCHAYTPYYYHLSNECILDANRRPVAVADYGCTMWGATPQHDKIYAKVSSQLPNNFQRVAINILQEGSFCQNIPKLRGSQVVKQRHLQIMGYQTVEIPNFEWNSLRLSDRQSKIDYLCKKIFRPS